MVVVVDVVLVFDVVICPKKRRQIIIIVIITISDAFTHDSYRQRTGRVDLLRNGATIATASGDVVPHGHV